MRSFTFQVLPGEAGVAIAIEPRKTMPGRAWTAAPSRQDIRATPRAPGSDSERCDRLMNGTGLRADEPSAAFRLDSTSPGAGRTGFDAFRRAWEAEIGDGFRLPGFSPDTTGDWRVKGRVARVRDVAITDFHAVSALRTEGKLTGAEDLVRMFVVRRGAWTVGGPLDRGSQTVRAGQFLLRHVGRPMHLHTLPGTVVKLLVLPSTVLKPLLGNRSVTGPADSAEVRLLAAHANIVELTAPDLGQAGVEAAHASLIELAKAVARGRFDDAEPMLAPALAQAAKELAESRLADPGLSPAMLARELHVSARTLQRALASVGESAGAYIRRRRLEEARLALTAPSGRLSITELAAYWQFADGGHFTRVFKKRYGLTPSEYARSARPGGASSM
jgi:AraC family transcriptional regulator, positive regulator of tynA and feaB